MTALLRTFATVTTRICASVSAKSFTVTGPNRTRNAKFDELTQFVAVLVASEAKEFQHILCYFRPSQMSGRHLASLCVAFQNGRHFCALMSEQQSAFAFEGKAFFSSLQEEALL